MVRASVRMARIVRIEMVMDLLRAGVGKRQGAALWVAVAVTFLLLYVRDLGEKSLWVDEYLTLDFAARDLGDVLRTAAADVHPPAYFVFQHFWLRVFGESDFALRLPSALFSTVSLVLLYLLGKQLYGRRVAAAAACFAVVSPFFLLFSHMARYYSLAMSASLLCTGALLLALERKRPAYWLAYGLTCSLVLYTDYPAAAVIGAHGVFLVGRAAVRYLAGHRSPGQRQALTSWLLSVVFSLVLYVPWVFVALGRLAQGGQGRLSDYAQGWMGIALKLGFFVYSFGLGETIFPWHPLALPALVAVLVALALGLTVRRAVAACGEVEAAVSAEASTPQRSPVSGGGGSGIRLSDPTSAYSLTPYQRVLLNIIRLKVRGPAQNIAASAGSPGLLAVLLGFSLLSTVFITTLVVPVVTFLNVGSRTMFAFPYFALLVVAGLLRMGRWVWLAVAIVAAANLASYADYRSSSGFLNPVYTVPSKQIAADVERMAQPGDVVISTVDTVFERYYGKTTAATSPHFLASAWDKAKSHIEAKQVRRVWLLTLGLDTNRDAYPAETAGWLRSHFRQTELRGYAEQDPTYRRIKDRLLKREAYRYKATLELYER